MNSTAPQPEVTQRRLLGMQVCVPGDFTDEQIVDFANTENPAGTAHGWVIRREGDERLCGCPERVPCSDQAARPGCVHVMLDC